MTLKELIIYSKTKEVEFQEHEFGFFPNFVAQNINRDTGINISGVTKIITNDSIRHIFKEHGVKKEKERGQKLVTDADIELIPKIVAQYDSVERGNIKHGQSVVFIKEINKITY